MTAPIGDPPELFDEVPSGALAVYAHPDDAEVSAGGTLARWVSQGAEVHLLVCTAGEKGASDPAADTAELTRLRAREVAAAADRLGLASHEILGVPDGELEADTSLRRWIVEAVRRWRPQVVVCPDPTAIFFGDTYVNHRDHRRAGEATVDAVAPAAAIPHYFPEAGEPFTVSTLLLSGTLAVNAWVDVSDHLDTKIEALLCHRTQLGPDVGPEGGTEAWFRDVLRQRAAEGGARAGTRYAEGFRRISLR